MSCDEQTVQQTEEWRASDAQAAEREVTLHLLEALGRNNHLHELIADVTGVMQRWSGSEAVGVRLSAGDDYPYFETRGFPAGFVEAERCLCERNEAGEVVRDATGNPVLECMCGNVIRGRFDPELPFFTAFGSFWTNSTTDLLASTSQADRQARTRNRCHGEGYESVALVPLRHGDRTFGLLQFNDSRRGCFDEEKVAALERLASSLSIGLSQRQAMAELRESRQLLADAERLAGMGSFVWDVEHDRWQVSENWLAIHGYQGGQLSTAELEPLAHPDDLPVIREKLAYALSGRGGYEMEHRIVRPDSGEVRWVRVKGEPVRDESGKVSHLMGVGIDITEQKRTTEALRDSSLRQKEAVKAGNIGLWDWDLRAGEVAYSREWKAQIGYEEHEIGNSFDEWESRVHPDDLPEALRRVEAMIDAREERYSIEFRFRHRNGSYRDILAQASVQLDERGVPVRVLGSHVDITEQKGFARRLQRSEQRYRDLVETMTYGVEEVDLDGRIVFANESYARMLGYETDEVIGRFIWDHDPSPEQVERLKAYLAELKAHQPPPEPYRSQNRRKDGTVIDVVVDWDYKRDAAGGLTGFASVVTDVTQRTKSEKALKESEERFRTLVEAAPVSILLLRDGQFIFGNRAGAELLGYDAPDEIAGLDVMAAIAPEFHSVVAERLGRVEAGEANQPVEMQLLRADGGRAWVSSISAPITVDGKRAAIAVGQDITDRKRAEEALRASELQKELILDTTSEMVAYHDLDLRIQWANRAAAVSVGQTVDDLVGRHCYEVWHQRDTPCEDCPVLKAMETGQPQSGEVQSPDGRCWRLRGYPVLDAQGQVSGLVEFGQDITEAKQREAQLRQAQKMEAVGRLSAGVAHDFNNQLQVILGCAEMLTAGRRPGDPLWETASEIQRAAERARSTTSHLLSFSRRQVLEPQTVSVSELLHEMERPVSRLIGEDIRLVVAVPPGVSEVFVDRSGLHQALMNLAVNARDAMPDGGTLVFRACDMTLDDGETGPYPEAVPGPYVLLEVVDDGAGMDRETLENLFEPFFTTKEAGKGTGLGMPMVQGFVRQSNGDLRVDSEPGKGTTVKILLPVSTSPRGTGEDADAQGEGASVHESKRILVVEDDSGVRFLVERILSEAGYEVWVADAPQAAIELIERESMTPDLVLADVIMPGMRGDELARYLESAGGTAPCVFMTGYAQVDVGEDEIIHKPFKPRELLEVIHRRLASCADGGTDRGKSTGV